MGLRGNGTIPAVYSERIKLAKHAGMQVMEMLRRNIRPRDIMTKEAFMNALTMDMALGCSTNSMLHLPAIAHEAGVELNVDIANEISARTPNLCHLAPAGHTYIEDLNEAGGIYAVMNEISKKGLLNLLLDEDFAHHTDAHLARLVLQRHSSCKAPRSSLSAITATLAPLSLAA